MRKFDSYWILLLICRNIVMWGWKSELRYFGRLQIVELRHRKIFRKWSLPRKSRWIRKSYTSVLKRNIDGDRSKSGDFFPPVDPWFSLRNAIWNLDFHFFEKHMVGDGIGSLSLPVLWDKEGGSGVQECPLAIRESRTKNDRWEIKIWSRRVDWVI